MTTLCFRLLNVFAESTFGGNPLAVIENGEELDDADMQRIARQFNLSETTFILPSDRAAARIRIFTPSYEMPFAGHPTLGSAEVVRAVLDAGDDFLLEMGAGLIPVRYAEGRWTLTANPPKSRVLSASRAELAATLGLPEYAIGESPLWLDCGTEQPMIPLIATAHVDAVEPDPALLARHCRNRNGNPKCYVFAQTPEGFVARYFWMSDEFSLHEDPGTGSAAANLGGWWQITHPGEPLSARIDQARHSDRPSVLQLDVAEGKIHVGGRVVAIGAGQLQLP